MAQYLKAPETSPKHIKSVLTLGRRISFILGLFRKKSKIALGPQEA